MIDNLNKRFTYKADPKHWDSWRFMSTTKPEIFGDCEDYALYVAKEQLSDGSLLQFWRNLWNNKFEFWYVKSGNGNGHCVLVEGNMAIDNWSKRWIGLDSMGKIHNFKYRYKFPIVLLKVIF
jgi:predicted transglutaminase-like cysteine proteinase